MTKLELIEGLQPWNNEADFSTYWAQTVETWGRKLSPRLPRKEDREDVVQEAFTKAWTKREQFEGNSVDDFNGWLSRIVRNSAYMLLRRQKARPDMKGEALNSHTYRLPDGHDIEHDIGVLQLCDVLERELPEDVALVYQKDVEGVSVDELANGRNHNTVKVNLGRARDRLRYVCQKHTPETAINLGNKPTIEDSVYEELASVQPASQAAVFLTDYVGVLPTTVATILDEPLYQNRARVVKGRKQVGKDATPDAVRETRERMESLLEKLYK